MKEYFNFELEPGKKLEKREYSYHKPVISVIIPFYNDGKYIERSVNCVLNQTFPYFELLIIDDGSKDEKSLEKLEEVSKLDTRIKVFHKKNEGLAATRDYGASKASKDTKYFVFFDSDDLMEKTYLECTYWALETNPNSSWAYTDSVGFENITYTWNKWFNSEKMKKVNDLVATALIRKSDFFEVKGYELREKGVNEDWNLWLKLIAKGKYPVHISSYEFWYRRKKEGELAKSHENKKRALEIINKTARTITKRVDAIQYPIQDYNYDEIPEVQDNIIVPESVQNDEKVNILMIIPWMIIGGADIFNLELVKRLDKQKFNITIVTTEPNINVLKQQFQEHATVYDLTTFLSQKNWLSFINYIIKKEKINLIFNTNSVYGYSILPYLKAKNPNIPILDYVHMEEWYYRNGGYARDAAHYEEVIDKTLVCNNGTKKVLEKHFEKRPEEVQTVYIGIDENKFDPNKFDKQELLKKYNLEDNKKTIISYICRISEQKRPLLLLQIMKKTLSKRNDVIFLIVGDGNLLDTLKSEVKRYNIENNVKFLGRTNATEEIYKISDITINCSIKEGVALTSYESLAMGVPVISSDVGGQAELINEEVGKIVPCMQKEKDIYNFNYDQKEVMLYVNAIDEIIEKLDYYKNNCRERILNKFTLNQMAEEMSKIFIEHKNNPNAEKVENGKALSKAVNITKELIISNLVNVVDKTRYQCRMYSENVYGAAYLKDDENYYKREIIKQKLWKFAIWRKFVKTKVWKRSTKVIKKALEENKNE